MFDLTAPEGVQAYLEQTPFAASDVTTLTGGNANFTYRITLRDPCAAPGLDVLVKTLVMKHAEPYVAVWKDIPFAVERQEFESLACKLIPDIVGPSSILSLPVMFYEDRANGVLLMSDSGIESRTLKATLQSGPLPELVARNIGAALGTFLARLHTATHDPAPETPAHTAKAAFATNYQGRTIGASFYFNQIVPTLTEGLPTLSPPLILPPESLAKLDAYAQQAHQRVNTSTDVLNMGDFWTGNMLLVLDPAPHITMIDWEAARPGFQGMDIGQFLAEMHLLRVFHPKSRACVDIIVAAFLNAYRAIFMEHGNGADADRRLTETAHDTVARVGVHLIIITPRVPWGGPELTREVVQEGVEYILRSVDGDEAWMRGSIVGGLWG